ncbi:ogr/Delta-like zinc finger family protein [Morganella psychrotolerans]|uniref:ogr/Delta-like zinc finger family protein n=1 Tax=Morganella psychrotolerans TaxID=368603 RepID=UPI0039A12CF3
MVLRGIKRFLLLCNYPEIDVYFRIFYIGWNVSLTCKQYPSESTIRKIETEGRIIPELYCSCDDPECGYTYVVTITYSHTIRQSKLDVPLPHRGLCIKVLNRQNAR